MQLGNSLLPLLPLTPWSHRGWRTRSVLLGLLASASLGGLISACKPHVGQNGMVSMKAKLSPDGKSPSLEVYYLELKNYLGELETAKLQLARQPQNDELAISHLNSKIDELHTEILRVFDQLNPSEPVVAKPP